MKTYKPSKVGQIIASDKYNHNRYSFWFVMRVHR